MTGTGGAERIQGAAVTPDFFKATAAKPLLGRLFLPEDYRGAAQYVLLSNRLWQRRFGGNPAVVGTKLELDGQSRTVIGVMPGDFDLPPGVEVWLPQETVAP